MGGSLTMNELRTAEVDFEWLRNPFLNRIARHPAIRAALVIAQTEADAQQIRTDPGLQAALGLLGHPAAQSIMVETDLLYGRAVYDSALDVGIGEALHQRSYLASDLMANSAYGIGIGNAEAFPALSVVLSHAAGRPINAGDLTPEEALAILDGYEARQRAETAPKSKPCKGAEPTAVSGLGNSRINRSIGPQWRGRRVNQLDAKREEQRWQGRTKPDIKLEICP